MKHSLRSIPISTANDTLVFDCVFFNQPWLLVEVCEIRCNRFIVPEATRLRHENENAGIQVLPADEALFVIVTEMWCLPKRAGISLLRIYESGVEVEAVAR